MEWVDNVQREQAVEYALALVEQEVEWVEWVELQDVEGGVVGEERLSTHYHCQEQVVVEGPEKKKLLHF